MLVCRAVLSRSLNVVGFDVMLEHARDRVCTGLKFAVPVASPEHCLRGALLAQGILLRDRQTLNSSLSRQASVATQNRP